MLPISEQVAGYLQSEGILFRRNPNATEPEFEFRVVAENCIADCRLVVDDEEKRLQISVSAGIRSRAGRIAETQVFTCQVSVGKRRSVLYQDYRTGEIVLHSVIVLTQPTISEQAFSRFIHESVARYDACFPFLARILYAKMTGTDAYRAYYGRNSADPEVRCSDEMMRKIEKLFEDYQPPDPET